MTFGQTWLILSDRYNHGYHNAQRRDAAMGETGGMSFPGCGVAERCGEPECAAGGVCDAP
jgi:hypothetical protein